MNQYVGEKLRTSWRWIGVMCVTVLISGCASVKMQSAKDSSFSNPCHQLFVIVNHAQLDTIDPAYTQYLIPALTEEFAAKKVGIQIRIISALDLDDNVYLGEIAAMNPDGVLTIVSNGGTVGPYGGAMQINYDISLYDQIMKKRVWRARLYASGGTGVREKRMKMMAQDLVNRLSEEGLISPEARKSGQFL
jgi:hypothetical protein